MDKDRVDGQRVGRDGEAVFIAAAVEASEEQQLGDRDEQIRGLRLHNMHLQSQLDAIADRLRALENR